MSDRSSSRGAFVPLVRPPHFVVGVCYEGIKCQTERPERGEFDTFEACVAKCVELNGHLGITEDDRYTIVRSTMKLPTGRFRHLKPHDAFRHRRGYRRHR